MKQKSQFGLLALLLAMSPLGVLAQTTFFSDNFSHGSTTNGSSIRTGSATASATSYDIASTKASVPGTNGVTIAPNLLHLALAAGTTSGFLEAQAMFATNGSPVALASVGDYIEITVVFTNSFGSMFDSTGAPLWIGLFNSGGNLPVAGNLAQSGLTTTAGSSYATGNCAGWQGYVSQVSSNGTSRLYTRPAQTTSTASSNQELLGNNFGSGAFTSPAGTVIATLSPNAPVPINNSSVYTLEMRLTLTSDTSLSISNFIYSGVGTGGTIIFANTNGVITNATFLTTAFDGFAIGLASKTTNLDPMMDISSITISGISTPITTPPTITLQPLPVVVATNGACIFTINAVGSGTSYQWKRNNAPLSNGGDISGVTSSQLVVSPAQAGDAFSTANGYYCTVTGTGGYSTNSVTNSLVLVPATNLIWNGAGGSIWDLNNTVSWQDSNSIPSTFNYGDSVRFDDTVAGGFITLSGSFLSAQTVTVSSASKYTFTGSGNIAGPGSLIYAGTGQLAVNNANTYSGGTLISNTTTPLSLSLGNFGGLGTGPVTVNNPGGTLESTVTGGSTAGINGIYLQSDFKIVADGNGTYAFVLLGDLSSSSSAYTLTMNPLTAGTTNRFRAYGTNTTFNANLVLDNNDTTVVQALYAGTSFAPYEGAGSQSYNGVISGFGGIVQRGSATTYLNNNQNSYSGGTFPTAGGIGFGADSIPTTGTVTSGPIGTGPLYLAPENGSTTGTGTVLASGGARTIANPLVYPSGTNNLTLVIGGTNDLTFTAPFALNGLDGQTSATYSSRLIQVTDTGAATLAGNITDTSGFNYALTKSGVGTLYLNGANTYPGVTTNTAGVLAGSGSLAGSVVVTTNASIGGGAASSIGNFTIGGSLTMSNANGYFRVNRAGFASDKVTVTGALTYTGTGTITVTNLGAALQVGDTFTLFSKAVTGGAALTVTNIGGGFVWSNSLAVNGTISVASIASAQPPKIFSVTTSGNNLILSGTNGTQGASYYVLSTTNLTLPRTSWQREQTNTFGTGGSLSATLPITPGTPAKFYSIQIDPP